MSLFAAEYRVNSELSLRGSPTSTPQPMTTHSHLKLGAFLLIALFSAQFVAARVVGRVHTMFQATVKIEVTGGPIIYVDPVNIDTSPADADFILITHNHPDHQQTAVIARLRKASTVIVSSPPGAPALMTAFPGTPVQAVIPGERLNLGGVEVETVPMYNVVKNTRHPRFMNFVGYVVNVGGVRVYMAGDTERFPEMKQFSADVVMLPLGQIFTMEAPHDAVEAALDLKARVAIAYHWGNAEGTEADADYFVAQLSPRMQAMKRTPPEGFALEVSETIAIAQHPASTTVVPGGRATLGVQATGSGTLRYQWRRNGLQIAGATTANLVVERAAAADAADYEVIVTDANGPVRSRMARLTVATPQPGALTNLSARGAVQGPGTAVILGAAVTGGSKEVLVRGIGPAIRIHGVFTNIPNPQIAVYGAVNGRDAVVATNDNWGADGGAALLRPRFAAAGAFPLDGGGQDAALVLRMDGPRRVHVTDTQGRNGVALVELYDLEPSSPGRLTNLSVRSHAGAGDATLIAGFVVSGNLPQRLLIRGLGPRLASGFGVTGALADPRLELYLAEDGQSTLFAANDNWAEGGVAPLRAAFAAAGAFDLPDTASRDAALVVTVPAGAFTVHLKGAGSSTGDALLELYELP